MDEGRGQLNGVGDAARAAHGYGKQEARTRLNDIKVLGQALQSDEDIPIDETRLV